MLRFRAGDGGLHILVTVSEAEGRENEGLVGSDECVSVDAKKCPALSPKHCNREVRIEEIFSSAKPAHSDMEIW